MDGLTIYNMNLYKKLAPSHKEKFIQKYSSKSGREGTKRWPVFIIIDLYYLTFYINSIIIIITIL